MAKLQKAAGNEGKRHAGWLDTHPAEQDRIVALEAHAAEAARKAQDDQRMGVRPACGEKRSLWKTLGLAKEEKE
jgi:predicted Zn-dependent protease